MPNKYDHNKIEGKWQELWSKENIYVADIAGAKNPFYNLWMFPYPSAEGLHAGHAFASTGSDIYGRFMRMQGRDVLQPIGYDSFGIHSENYAIKIGQKPQEVIKRTRKHYEGQMRALGHGYDWTRTLATSDIEYYKWTQWLFLKMWENGLAYKKKAKVNFCPSCKTVLADEQVIDGKCERCGTVVIKKALEQWFFRITKYADRLLGGLDKIKWSQRVVTAQRNWIGKSEGMMIKFGDYEVFTTRPDTLNAVTFLATSKLYEEGSKEKIGKFSGKYAIEPLGGRKIPIWDTNYVAPDYGTGIIMGVPAHDERDMEFAKKYKIDIVDKEPDEKLWELIEESGWGKKHTNFHLRDWLVSRQRYWGAPIPMIYCKDCALKGKTFKVKSLGGKDREGLSLQGMPGWFPVAEKDLPVALPDINDFKPEGTGKGPLANHKEFYEVNCPNCGEKAQRETDVMDTFVDSSWYFLRYPSLGLKGDFPWEPKITEKWLPVDLYFGGAEHSVLHLMYARFVTMVLHDLKLTGFDEPFPRFFAHGLMIKDGAKMSKSRGNVVNPDEYMSKYGADTLRLYLMFLGPMDGSPDFRDEGIEGMRKFLVRVWNLYHLEKKPSAKPNPASAAALENKLHMTIKGVTQDIEEFKYNTAISKLMEFVNALYDAPAGTRNLSVWSQALKSLCLLMAPFAPHMSEELWVEVLREPFSIHKASWPHYNAEFAVSNEAVIVVQVNGRVRGQIVVGSKESMSEKEMIKLAKEDEKVKKWIGGARIKKEIFVPGKLVNFVV